MWPEYLVSLGIVLIISLLMIFIYKWKTGNYPMSKLIITDPPIEHNGLEPTQAKFMFFYTTWCPYCTNAQKPWRIFKQQLKDKPMKYGNYIIQFEEINAEKNKSKAALYKITEYPTFKVETHKKVIEMKGVPDILNFDQFLISALGKKTPA
jgi:thiol-disulfide isomerase/thioredoxin